MGWLSSTFDYHDLKQRQKVEDFYKNPAYNEVLCSEEGASDVDVLDDGIKKRDASGMVLCEGVNSKNELCDSNTKNQDNLKIKKHVNAFGHAFISPQRKLIVFDDGTIGYAKSDQGQHTENVISNSTEDNKKMDADKAEKDNGVMKICFLAPSGYGKTTAVKILSKHYKVKSIKIAEPLYELQKEFYNFIGKSITGEQDGELLQFLGKKIRKENPSFLLEKFMRCVIRTELCDKNVELIINDDCRPMDYNCLKELGFKFVSIEGFERDRQDHIPIDSNNQLEWKKNIPYDYIVSNMGSMGFYEDELLNLIKRIEKDQKVISFNNSVDSDLYDSQQIGVGR